jgi:hypothetical protein
VRADLVKATAPPALELPKSAHRADRALVDLAVTHIKGVLARTVARGTEEIGRYLLETFYDGDPQKYLSFAPGKHASITMLVARCESLELPVSRTFLGNALRMAAISKGLPKSAAFNQLPPSHRVELLRVREPEQLKRLAARTVEANLSVEKLRALIRKELARADGASPTKKPRGTPQIIRSLELCANALRDEETGRLPFFRSDVEQLSEEQQRRARKALEQLTKRVGDLQRLLG